MGRRVWIDLENSPHVLFFLPWTEWLRAEGHEVVLSARDLSQTCDLLRLHGMPFAQIGGHARGGRLRKAGSILRRAYDLALWARPQRFDLALGHGSRAQAVAAAALGVPGVTFFDYEHISSRLFGLLSREILVPDAVPREVLRRRGIPLSRLVSYPGFKEQVYLDPNIDRPRPARPPRILVRPPARRAHYHARASEEIFRRLIARLGRARGDRAVLLLPRYPDDVAELRSIARANPGMSVVDEVRPGRDLILESSLVVSGGGTMVREAAVLGVPAASYFAGPMGGVDRRLVELGRLRILSTADDVENLYLPDGDALAPEGNGPGPIPDSQEVRDFLRARLSRWLA